VGKGGLAPCPPFQSRCTAEWWARHRTRPRPMPLPTLRTGSAQRRTAIQPYRRVANLRKHFRQSVAAAASLAVTHSPRKSRLLPHEKNAPRFCHRFVATKSHDVNVRRGPLLATRLKRLTQLWISHHTARHPSRAASSHAAQVLQAMMDFGASESARRAMWIKRLKRRDFSLSSARRKLRTAFSPPQRA
jgi:hypothetical protein